MSHIDGLDVLFEGLLTKKVRLAIVCTGGGAGIQEILWNVPGISSVLVEAAFPYAPSATEDYLGFQLNDGFCTKKVAIQLAMEAYYRAYDPKGDPALGVGLTASVASTREHRGEHRVFAAFFSDTRCEVYSVTLDKGVGVHQRIRDGQICDLLAARTILEGVGSINLPLIHGVKFFDIETGWDLARDLFFEHPFFEATGRRHLMFPLGTYQQQMGAIYPGSFNPPHPGHFGMVDSYRGYTRGPVAFNIEAEPPHKDPLTTSDLLRRAKMLKGRHDIIFTRKAPLYVDKSALFPRVAMLVGADTMLRLTDPKWGPSMEVLTKCFESNHTTFFVADRLVEGKLVSLRDIPTSGIRCYPLIGRWDCSSTEIRKGSQ